MSVISDELKMKLAKYIDKQCIKENIDFTTLSEPEKQALVDHYMLLFVIDTASKSMKLPNGSKVSRKASKKKTPRFYGNY